MVPVVLSRYGDLCALHDPARSFPSRRASVLGPTVFDRVQAGNTIGTLAMMLMAVMGFLAGRPEFLDLAITYGLLNVISTIAVLKFFRRGDLGADAEPRA
jgi:multicomponent Na+:H+ antiporter subunit F